MLEEALRNEKSHPAETAFAMLTFLQSEMPAGGAAAEARFFNMYGVLCERIFGAIGGKEDGYRHRDGGWLSAQVAWSRPSSLGSSGGGGSSAGAGMVSPSSARRTTNALGQQISKVRSATAPSNSIENDPVFKLLAAAGPPLPGGGEPAPPTLIEAISKESENRPGVGFAFPFHALPQSLQGAWLALVEASTSGMLIDPYTSNINNSASTVTVSTNEQRLLSQLLRKRPEEQMQLRLYLQRSAQQQQPHHPHHHLRQPLQLSPRVGLHGAAASPSSHANLAPGSSNQKEAAEVPPRTTTVTLSMLEYYLVLFLRFPLAAPDRSKPPGSNIPGVHAHRMPPQRRTSEAYGDTLYFQLFQRLVRHFLPKEAEENRYIDFSSSGSSNNSMSGGSTFYAESELFVRLLMALWLEPLRLAPTPKIVQTIHERRGLALHPSPTAERLVLDLNASYDLVVLSPAGATSMTATTTATTPQAAVYRPPPSMVHRCVRSLLIAAVLDPALRRNCRSTTASGTPSLTTCLAALQPAVYNHVRASFRFASIHAAESSFFGALNAWLIWLEPWNLTQSRSYAAQRIMKSATGGPEKTKAPQLAVLIPSYSQPSKYDPSWEPYIAANLFMYCVPLAIFLRRARELDFSAGKFERSIQIVKRVFRVFSPDVVNAISKYLDETTTTSSNALLRSHLEALGPFAPPAGQAMSLSSLKDDMQSLLEEIDMQHMKKVRELDFLDRMIGRVEGFFGKGVVSGEEKTLGSLIERAKLIARLPIDYEILPSSKSSTGTSGIISEEQDRLRNEDGELSEYGRQQLLRGQIKCDPSEVPYRGDKMRRRAGAYEIPWLMNLTIRASDWCNERLGLSKSGGKFRINLRFLADYRNAMFFILVAFVLLKIVL